MIGTIQTHGELMHWHPHIHVLVTCGGFTPDGKFHELTEFDLARLEAAWQEAVFALYLAEEKIAPEVVENMRAWPHSGFSVDQSVFLAAGDRPGIERLVAYMTRCPFSLSRLVKLTRTGQVIYKAEKDACRAFPEADGDGLRPGPRRNFQVLDPLDFLAEFTQHIPPKGSHLIRYYGWYSNKSRGMRKKVAEAEAAEQPGAPSSSEASEPPAPSRCSQTWAMLIKRVYEADPLACPQCGGQMSVIAFIEPPQADVIEKILRHCGLWHSSSPRAPPDGEAFVHDPDGDGHADSDEPRELRFVPEDAIWAEADALLDADAFAGDAADDWYRQPAEDEPRELTYVDEDTFWREF